MLNHSSPRNTPPADVLSRTPDGVALTSPAGALLHPIPVHSPTGFEYGYAGSGPAETACVILRDFLARRWQCAPERVVVPAEMYQAFKRDIIARLNEDASRHTISTDSIVRWLRDNGWALDVLAAVIHMPDGDIIGPFLYCVRAGQWFPAPHPEMPPDLHAQPTAEADINGRAFPVRADAARQAGCPEEIR